MRFSTTFEFPNYQDFLPCISLLRLTITSDAVFISILHDDGLRLWNKFDPEVYFESSCDAVDEGLFLVQSQIFLLATFSVFMGRLFRTLDMSELHSLSVADINSRYVSFLEQNEAGSLNV